MLFLVSRLCTLSRLGKSWDAQEIGKDDFLFGVEDLEEEKGIKVEWMKSKNWGSWMENRFCSRED